jgi:hypothetical protein
MIRTISNQRAAQRFKRLHLLEYANPGERHNPVSVLLPLYSSAMEVELAALDITVARLSSHPFPTRCSNANQYLSSTASRVVQGKFIC